VEDNERLGRLVTMKTNENIGKVRPHLRTDRHLGIRVVAKYLHMDKKRREKF
jgi:hypothetical protein